jgi:hypothetical protein
MPFPPFSFTGPSSAFLPDLTALDRITPFWSCFGCRGPSPWVVPPCGDSGLDILTGSAPPPVVVAELVSEPNCHVEAGQRP